MLVACDTKGEPVLPVRIYALAKELKVDSKDLVDICAKAGITGKGSALASLTDEESDKVKSFVAGGGRSSSAAPAKPTGPSKPKVIPVIAGERPADTGELRREDYIAPGGGLATGKPKAIPAPPSKSKPPADPPQPAAESDADPIEPAVPSVSDGDVETPVAETPVTELPVAETAEADTELPSDVPGQDSHGQFHDKNHPARRKWPDRSRHKTNRGAQASRSSVCTAIGADAQCSATAC